MTDPSDPEAAATLPVYKMPEKYLDTNFWDRGPKSKAGATNEKFIYIAVGHALSNWEHVECAAATLFAHFVESNSIAALRSYGTINSSRAKATALRQASETYFLLRKNTFERGDLSAIETMKAYSNKFVDNYATASGRRNDIAHGMAYELSDREKDEQSWYLAAPNYQSPKTANWINDDI